MKRLSPSSNEALSTQSSITGNDEYLLSTAGAVHVTSGGLIATSYIGLNSINATVVKNSGGQVFLISMFNNGTDIAYLKLYDKQSTPDPAIDVPVWRMMSHPGYTENTLNGIALGNGISFLVTGQLRDFDATPISADTVYLNISYK